MDLLGPMGQTVLYWVCYSCTGSDGSTSAAVIPITCTLSHVTSSRHMA